MALSGNYISVNALVERIYRNSGYQTIDWNEAVEYIADVMGLIGAKESFVTVTTNGLNGSPVPLQVVDYRATLPPGFVSYISCRKIHVASDGTIAGFYPMIYSTDIYHQSPIKKIKADIPPGTYDYTEYAWGEDGEFTPAPIIVEGDHAAIATDHAYTYKVNNGFIETSFEDGFIELVYTTYKIDEHGLPMIPDDIRYINAVISFITERLDYKKWRSGELADKIYRHSEQQRDWAIASARGKSAVPTIDRMESWKNSMVRSIPKFNNHRTGFKYANIPERRKD